MKPQLERFEMQLTAKEKKLAMKKAKPHLETLSGNQKNSLNAAIRYCIQIAPENLNLGDIYAEKS